MRMPIEGELNAIVREYLELNGFESTLKTFEEDCRSTGKPLDLEKVKHSRELKIKKIKDDLLGHFTAGDESRFFLQWSSHLTPTVLNTSKELLSEAADLELELRVHFAVHPQRAQTPDKLECEEAMLRFRTFLESRGSAMSESSPHLHYYALPYVSKLRDHQTFSRIFNDEWLATLRTRLETYVDEVLQLSELNAAKNKSSRLSYLYHCADSELNDLRVEMSVLEKRLEESTAQNSSTTRQLLRLEEEQQRLIGVTGELISALESAIQGQTVDMRNILAYCEREVPSLLAQLSNRSPMIANDGSPDELKEAAAVVEGVPAEKLPVNLVAYELNYQLVKNELLRGDLETKCRLIQALRWQLTKCGSPERRHSTLMAFISHDLLGCFKRQSEYATRLLHFIRSPSARLQQGVCRLINAFASFCKGRSYLSRNTQLVSVMVDALVNDQLDPVARDMVIASLQKLSLRRALTVIMIDSGAMDWLLRQLPLEAALGSYAFEYAAALFMNLSLSPHGRRACAAQAPRTLDVVLQLYDRKVPEIYPYLNGALYSLIGDTCLLQEAKIRQLSDRLTTIQTGCSEELQNQISCIIERMDGTDTPAADDKDEEKPEEEETTAQVDEIELEIDQGEPNAQEDTDQGESLLWKLYTQQANTGTADVGKQQTRRSMSTGPRGGQPVGRRQTQTVNPMPNYDATRKSRSSGRTKSPSPPELPLISNGIRKIQRASVSSQGSVVVPSSSTANVLQVNPVVRATPNPEPVNLPEILSSPQVLGTIQAEAVFAARPKVPRTPEGTRR